MTKVIAINTVIKVRKSDQMEIAQVFGLGEDGKVYQWSYKEGKWSIYSKSESSED